MSVRAVLCIVWMGVAACEETATHTRPDPDPAPEPPVRHALSVTVSGPGSVTSVPSGIDCPGSCSAEFVEGAEVTLRAVTAPPFELEAWGGDCAGTSACLLTLASSKSVSATLSHRPVSPLLFGVNTHWVERGDGIATGGDLLRDRSFRIADSAGVRAKHYWLDTVIGNGTVSFAATGGDTGAAGGHAYDGHATLTAADAGSQACVWQQSMVPAVAGESYTARLSVRGVGAARDVGVLLVDGSYSSLLDAAYVVVPSQADVWTQPSVPLAPTRSSGVAILGVCFGLAAGTVDVDEVRLLATGDALGIDTEA